MTQQTQNDMIKTPYHQAYIYFDSPQRVTSLNFQNPL